MKKSKLIRTLFILAALAALLSTLSIGALASSAKSAAMEDILYNVEIDGDDYDGTDIYFTVPKNGTYTICTLSEDPERDDLHMIFFYGDTDSSDFTTSSSGNGKNCHLTVRLTEGDVHLIVLKTFNYGAKITVPVQISYDNGAGSVLSEGSLWIVVAVAVVAAGGITALVIAKKKKTGEE